MDESAIANRQKLLVSDLGKNRNTSDKNVDVEYELERTLTNMHSQL